MPVSSNVSHHPKPHHHGRHLFLVTQFLWHSNIPMLRHQCQVSPSFALRAAAHRAQSVRRIAAQSATRRTLEVPQLIQRSGFTSKVCPASNLLARSFATPTAFASHAPRKSTPSRGSRHALLAALAPRLANPNNHYFCLRAAPSTVSISIMSHINHRCASKALANQSLNRTFCGVGQSGFISFSPNYPTPQNAG